MATIAHRGVAGEEPDARRGEEADRPACIGSTNCVAAVAAGPAARSARQDSRRSGFPAICRHFCAHAARSRGGGRAQLFDLCAGFVYSQILLACVRLKLFDQLTGGPLSAAELSSRLPLPADATVLLLDAAVSLQLLQRRSDGRYGLGSLGAALLGNPGVVAMIEHHAMLYGDLKDPIALLRGDAGAGQLAAYWPYAGNRTAADLSHEAIAPYTALMAASQPMISQQVLSAYSFRGHRCLLDIGGGDGSFIAAVAAQTPNTALRAVRFARGRRPGQRTVSFRRAVLARGRDRRQFPDRSAA